MSLCQMDTTMSPPLHARPRNLLYQNMASSPLPTTHLLGLAQLPNTKARLN